MPGAREPFTVRVARKVPIARLFFLLGHSLDPTGGWRDGDVGVAEDAGLLPAFGFNSTYAGPAAE